MIQCDSKKLYLSPELNIAKMHKLFKEMKECYPHSKITESSYWVIFCSEFNISFDRPPKNQCDVCKTYQNSSIYCWTTKNTNWIWQTHGKENKIKTRKKKEKYRKDKNTIVSCFDLEQILTNPHAFQSTLYYNRKLNTFNFTIYNLCSSDGHC